jgi:hypothetical protein
MNCQSPFPYLAEIEQNLNLQLALISKLWSLPGAQGRDEEFQKGDGRGKGKGRGKDRN